MANEFNTAGVPVVFSGVPLNLDIANHPHPAWSIDKARSSEFFQVPRPIYRESPSYFPYNISSYFPHISSFISFISLHYSSYFFHISSYSWNLETLRAFLQALGLGKISSYFFLFPEVLVHGKILSSPLIYGLWGLDKTQTTSISSSFLLPGLGWEF